MKKLVALFGTLLLAGCGAAPSLPVAPVPEPLGPATQPIGIPPAGLHDAPQGDARAQALLAGMARATRELRSASYQGLMYCRGSYGKKPAPLKEDHGEWEANTTYKVQFKAPGTYRIDVTQCTNQSSVGMKMLVRGENAKVRVPGLLGLMKFDLTLGDSRMRNFRGHRLDDGSFTGIAERLAQPPAPEARWVGETAIGGRMLDVVEVARTPAFDHTIVKEIVGVDRLSHLPLLHAMFTAQRKVYEMKVQNLQVNGTLPEDFEDI